MDLWKKKFIIIWSGQLFSILSSAIVGYSVMFWLSIETKSAEVLSYAVLATLLPQALLGPIAGVYVDRWKRKLTMIAADSFVALCSLILGGLFYFDQAELGLIYLLMALRSTGNAFPFTRYAGGYSHVGARIGINADCRSKPGVTVGE